MNQGASKCVLEVKGSRIEVINPFAADLRTEIFQNGNNLMTLDPKRNAHTFTACSVYYNTHIRVIKGIKSGHTDLSLVKNDQTLV